MEPLYVAPPGGMRWFNALLSGLVALGVVLSVVLLALEEAAGALVTMTSVLLTAGIIWAVLPRRYEVWPEHLRIVLPLWRWDIEYEGIDTVRAGYWYEAYGFIGVRFATAPSQTVTVLRRNANLFTHPNLVISPEDREDFLRQLQRAMRR